MPQQKIGSTSVIEARLDTRVLARLAEALALGGVPFHTKGELVRKSLEVLYSTLFEDHRAEDYRSITAEEGLEILAQFGITGTNSSGKNLASLRRTIANECRLEMASSLPAEAPATPQDTTVDDLIQELQKMGFTLPGESEDDCLS